MCKRILLSTIAAGTVLMGVNIAAADDRFVFRGKPGVITLAAATATPEIPNVPDEGDPRRQAFETAFQATFGFPIDDPEAENITEPQMEYFLIWVVAYDHPDIDAAIKSHFSDEGWSLGSVLPPFATMRDFFEKAVIPVFGCPENCS